MAWLTREEPRSYSRAPKEPDMETLSYWLARLEPLIRAETEGEIIVVLANRCGTEGEAVYAGTSAILGIQGGEVKVYGILGRGEKELLVVDTTKRPQAKLISEPNSTVSSNRDSSFSNPRTSSTLSENSMTSNSTGLSITTQGTAYTSPSPATPDAMDIKIDEMIAAPLSPVDARSPSQFFAPHGRKGEPETLRESLQSSIGQPQQVNGARSDSPVFVRPPSPKSRNASRSRQPEQQEPALISHDLAKEPQITSRAAGVKSPPHSASALPDQFESTFMSQGLGPRDRHRSPRPKSTIW
jgi:protein N-terminal amidase